MAALHILAAGPHCTVQDRGRRGFGHVGLAAAGALDERLHEVAQALVGNPRDFAGLEFAAAGPTVTAVGGAVLVAVAGDGHPRLGGLPMQPFRSVWLEPGQILEIAGVSAGFRGYLAVAGGLAVASTLGSRASHAAAGLGWQGGRRLRDGDILEVGDHRQLQELQCDPLPIAHSARLPALWTGHANELTRAARAALIESEWTVSPQSDRAAVLLDGASLDTGGTLQRISQPTTFGSVQVAGDGQPRILLCEGPTVGGYLQPLVVCSGWRSVLAQLAPASRVRFHAVDLSAALAISQAADAELARTVATVRPAWPPTSRSLLAAMASAGR